MQVLEETSYDISPKIIENDFVEMHIGGRGEDMLGHQKCKLFIIQSVSTSFNLGLISDLPTIQSHLSFAWVCKPYVNFLKKCIWRILQLIIWHEKKITHLCISYCAQSLLFECWEAQMNERHDCTRRKAPSHLRIGSARRPEILLLDCTIRRFDEVLIEGFAAGEHKRGFCCKVQGWDWGVCLVPHCWPAHHCWSCTYPVLCRGHTDL